MTSTGGQGVTHVYGVFGFSLTTIFTQIFVRLGGKQYSILKYMVGLPLSSFIKPLYFVDDVMILEIRLVFVVLVGGSTSVL